MPTRPPGNTGDGCKNTRIWTQVVQPFGHTWSVDDGKVGLFARLKRSYSFLLPNGVGCVDGGTLQRFIWRYSQHGARERKSQWQMIGGGRSRIEITGNC